MSALTKDQLEQLRQDRLRAYASIEIPKIVREDADREFFLTTTTLALDSEGRVDIHRTMRNEGVRMAWLGLFRAIDEGRSRDVHTPMTAVSATAER